MAGAVFGADTDSPNCDIAATVGVAAAAALGGSTKTCLWPMGMKTVANWWQPLLASFALTPAANMRSTLDSCNNWRDL